LVNRDMAHLNYMNYILRPECRTDKNETVILHIVSEHWKEFYFTLCHLYDEGEYCGDLMKQEWIVRNNFKGNVPSGFVWDKFPILRPLFADEIYFTPASTAEMSNYVKSLLGHNHRTFSDISLSAVFRNKAFGDNETTRKLDEYIIDLITEDYFLPVPNYYSFIPQNAIHELKSIY